MSFRPSVCQKLKIVVTTEPIEFYSSGNKPTGPVLVLSYFLGGWDNPNPQKNKPLVRCWSSNGIVDSTNEIEGQHNVIKFNRGNQRRKIMSAQHHQV